MKVKSLRDYIEKIANDKKNNLKHLNDADKSTCVLIWTQEAAELLLSLEF